MLSGNIVTAPRRSDHSNELVTFRMASTQTYWKDGAWHDRDTVYIDVQCWNTLGVNVLNSVMKGMPVFVRGELTYFEYEPEDGPRDRNNQPVKFRLYRVRASTVGMDLNWAQVRKWVRQSGDKDAIATPASQGDAPAGSGGAADSGTPAGGLSDGAAGESTGTARLLVGADAGEVVDTPF